MNVTARFQSLFWAGFIIELLILLLITLNMILGNKLIGLSNLFGYGSFIWFVVLLFFRFDHFGKVCSGDYLAEGEANKFEAIQHAGSFFKIFSQAIGYSMGALFLIVLIFTFFADSRRSATEEEDKKE